MNIEKIRLSNFLSRLKKQRFGDCTIHISSVREWCEKYSIVPDSEDEVFVSNTEFDVSATEK